MGPIFVFANCSLNFIFLKIEFKLSKLWHFSKHVNKWAMRGYCRCVQWEKSYLFFSVWIIQFQSADWLQRPTCCIPLVCPSTLLTLVQSTPAIIPWIHLHTTAFVQWISAIFQVVNQLVFLPVNSQSADTVHAKCTILYHHKLSVCYCTIGQVMCMMWFVDKQIYLYMKF